MNSNDKTKLDINNITIPESLNNVVESSLKKGRRERVKSKLKGVALGLLVMFISFAIAVNTIDSVASAAYKIPILKDLTRLVDLDKGYDNAINSDLVVNIGYEETKNGVTLKVNRIVGDYKSMWLEYEVISDIRVRESLSFNDKGEYKNMPSSGIGNYTNEDSRERYSSLYFGKPVKNFGVIFTMINSEEGSEIVKFEVPITLNDNMMKSSLKKIDIKEATIDTEAGGIRLSDFQSTITRVKAKINLNSDKYMFSGFNEPRLIVDGRVQNISSGFVSKEDGADVIEFQGSIQGAKSIEFQCNGVYYMNKTGNRVYIDFVNKKVSDNIYGIEINTISNMSIGLKTSKITKYILGDIYDMNGNAVTSGASCSNVQGDIGGKKGYMEMDYILKERINKGYIDITGANMYQTKGFTLKIK
ncbi:MAG: DUF4179 domain-containing protein [Clostridium sp.]